jgi:hypothetical protein
MVLTTKCVLIFCTDLSKTFVILRIHRHIGFHVKYCYSCQTLMKFEFPPQICEIYSNFMKILLWESSCSMRTDGQT